MEADHPGQLDLVGQQERLAIGLLDFLDLDPGVVGVDGGHEPVRRPAAEWNLNPVPGDHLHAGRYRVGVGFAVDPTGRFDSDLSEKNGLQPPNI